MPVVLNRKKLSIVGNGVLNPRLIQALTYVSGSVAVIVVNKDGTNSDMQGTGFCVDERGLFLTAYHYLGGFRRSSIILDREYVAEPVAVDEEKDLALFSITSPAPGGLKPLRFAVSLPLPGTALIGIGHVMKETGLSLGGYAASYVDRLDAVIADSARSDIDPERLESSVVLSGSGLCVPGFSGGPILNEHGEVEAMTSGGDGDSYVTAVCASAARELTEWYRARMS